MIKNSISERAISFGPGNRNVGIYTQSKKQAPNRPAVLLLNAGLIHHVGPNRIYVKLARRLAEEGIPAFRFDFSGIGDSCRRVGPFDARQYQIEETQWAMQTLQKQHGINCFMLAGLCSGADVALETAQMDDRVKELVLVNGFFLPRIADKSFYRKAQDRTYARLARFRLSDPLLMIKTIMQKLSMQKAWRFIRRVSKVERTAGSGSNCDKTSSNHALKDIPTLLLFSEGSTALDVYELLHKNLFKELADKGMLRQEVVKGADHLFTPLWAQCRLIESIASWIISCEENSLK